MRGALQQIGVVTSRDVLMKQSKTWLVNYIIALSYFFKQFPMTDYLKQVRNPTSSYWDYKSKLPRLRTTKRKALPRWVSETRKRETLQRKRSRKTKRKKLTGAAKAKFLARMNKGRRKKGLKPIRSR